MPRGKKRKVRPLSLSSSLWHCSMSCICICFSELVPVSMAMPVCLFEVSEHSPECLTSIGEILVSKGLASLNKQYLPSISEFLNIEILNWKHLQGNHLHCLLTDYTEIYIILSPLRVATEKPLTPELAVWDPPLMEAGSSPSALALQPSLTLPTCLKDVKVKVTHVTSPGNICVQLLQYDTQLKRYRPDSLPR